MASPNRFKRTVVATSAALIVVALGAALFIRQTHRQGSQPDLVAELGLSAQPHTQLYAPIPRKAKLVLAPGEVAPDERVYTCHGSVLAEDFDRHLLPALDRVTYVPENMGLLGAGERYLQGTDLSLEKIVMQPDGQWVKTSDTYYPRRTKHSTEPWHPHVHTAYADDSALVVDQVTYWYEGGKPEKWLHVDEAKRRHVLEFAQDGLTVLSEQWYQLPFHRYDNGYLISEQHWQVNDGQTTLSYSNFRHDDGSRTITTWDEHHKPLVEMSRDKYDVVAGTKVIGYYPGTEKHRFEGEANANYDNVNFFRPDRTLSLNLAIASCTSEFTYYDSTGKNKTLTQTFMRNDVVENGVKKAIYSPIAVMEFDANGKETFEYFIQDNKVDSYEKVGVTVNGINYKKAYFSFVDGKLDLVSHWVTDADKSTPDDVDKNPTFTFPMAEIAPEKLQPLVQITDDLPVPPVEVPEHGGP